MSDFYTLKELITAHSKTINKKLSIMQKAGLAWNSIAGDIGRRHTLGLFIKENPTENPSLYVYLDSSALIQDFQTNHLLYEQKMEMMGFPVKEVIFKLSKKTRSVVPVLEKVKKKTPIPQPVSDYDKKAIEKLSRGLSGSLQQNFKSALLALKKYPNDKKL